MLHDIIVVSLYVIIPSFSAKNFFLRMVFFLFDKLEAAKKHFDELSKQICDPEIISDIETYTSLCRKHSELLPVMEKYSEYKKEEQNISDTLTMLGEGTLDQDMRNFLNDELSESKSAVERIKNELVLLLMPKDPNDSKNVIMEIRGGAGGDEASLFAADLLRMYQMYAESKNFKIDVLNLASTELGGIKEVAFQVQGSGAYSLLKYESGVHRVQRVPSTESSGRIHTSTVTVAVLPEIEEVEININPADLRIDVFRAGGPGGQCVNTTDSAVRITHMPTGVVVSCQDEKSQHKNKDKAMKILRSRVYEIMQSKQNEELAQERKSQVGTGDRSERIRTYNFPQGRVTDHRIGLTLHRLDSVMNGDLDEIITALNAYFQAQNLQKQV